MVLSARGHFFFCSSAKWIGDDGDFFTPCWIHLASPLGAKARRRRVLYNDTEKDENKGATLCKKKWQEVAPDDNNNR